jgi:hypothetical protein
MGGSWWTGVRMFQRALNRGRELFQRLTHSLPR